MYKRLTSINLSRHYFTSSSVSFVKILYLWFMRFSNIGDHLILNFEVFFSSEDVQHGHLGEKFFCLRYLCVGYKTVKMVEFSKLGGPTS